MIWANWFIQTIPIHEPLKNADSFEQSVLLDVHFREPVQNTDSYEQIAVFQQFEQISSFVPFYEPIQNTDSFEQIGSFG